MNVLIKGKDKAGKKEKRQENNQFPFSVIYEFSHFQIHVQKKKKKKK